MHCVSLFCYFYSTISLFELVFMDLYFTTCNSLNISLHYTIVKISTLSKTEGNKSREKQKLFMQRLIKGKRSTSSKCPEN